MPIYQYIFNKDEPIKQGDIFRNLPNISLDLLFKSSFEEDKPTRNQSNEILTDILQNGNITQIETILSSTCGILASQDCEIRKDHDLIFIPLEKIDPFTPKTIDGDIKTKIVDTVRKFYLPELNSPRFQSLGPFHAIFERSFRISYNILIKNIESCWVARIKEPSRKYFIGKLTHFFSRPPIDEFLFIEDQQILDLINKLKTKATTPPKIRKLLEDIENIKKTLRVIKRSKELFEAIELIKKEIESLK